LTKVKEKEANFLAAELLVPYEAALKAAFGEKTNDEIAVAYGVSTQFAQMRMAGARMHAARALAKQAGSKHEAGALVANETPDGVVQPPQIGQPVEAPDFVASEGSADSADNPGRRPLRQAAAQALQVRRACRLRRLLNSANS
jgi:hypothetical protein